MSDNLKKETLKALFWSSLERFGSQFIQFAISIAMARLLSPEDFGLIAMLYIFINLSNTLINSGFGQALVQKREANYTDECSIFYFNIIVALFTIIILFFCAPFIADFYNQPKLIQMSRVLSLTLLFNSLGLVQRTLLTKNLEFKIQLKVSLLSICLSAILCIPMALNGYGVWSLVALFLCNDFFLTLFLWIFSPWRPSFVFSIISLKSMFSFGSRLFLVSLLNSVFGNIYQIIIGKLFSPSTLGFYSRADSLSKYPVTIISGIISSVTFPVFSRIQNDKKRLKSSVIKVSKMLTVITFPLMIGFITVAHPLVEVLLTEKWLPSVLYLQLLCLIGLVYPISVINLNALNAQGRSELFLKIDLVNKILILIVVMITYRFGIIAMIIGQIANSFFSLYLYSFYNSKLLTLTLKSQIKGMIPAFSVSIVMGLVVYSIKYIYLDDQLLLLVIQMTLGVLVYISLCFIFKISAFMEVIIIIKDFIPSRKSKNI